MTVFLALSQFNPWSVKYAHGVPLIHFVQVGERACNAAARLFPSMAKMASENVESISLVIGDVLLQVDGLKDHDEASCAARMLTATSRGHAAGDSSDEAPSAAPSAVPEYTSKSFELVADGWCRVRHVSPVETAGSAGARRSPEGRGVRP